MGKYIGEKNEYRLKLKYPWGDIIYFVYACIYSTFCSTSGIQKNSFFCSLHKDMKSYKQTEQQCKEMGGTLLNVPQSNAYEYLKLIITEEKTTYVSFWVMVICLLNMHW